MVNRMREAILALGQVAQAVGHELAIHQADRDIVVLKKCARGKTGEIRILRHARRTNKTRRCNVLPRRNQATSATSDCSVGFVGSTLRAYRPTNGRTALRVVNIRMSHGCPCQILRARHGH